MKKKKTALPKQNIKSAEVQKQTIVTSSTVTTDSDIELYQQATNQLMPELEELVKKNPNRLIGCGG